MRCSLYSDDGQLLLEGPCGVRPDGDIEMVPSRQHRRLTKGEGPLLLVDGPRHYPVVVHDAHGVAEGLLPPPAEVYHLTPVDGTAHAPQGEPAGAASLAPR